MAQVVPATGFDLRLLVVAADQVTGGPVKAHCPNPDHDDRVSSCAVYHDHLYCFACGLRLGFQDAVNALEPSLAPLKGRERLEALGRVALADRVPQAKAPDLSALEITAYQGFVKGLNDVHALDWWAGRGFGLDELIRYGFGATTRAYTVPLVGLDGFWGLKYRRRDDGDRTVPKYWSPAGQRGGAYVPPLARVSATVVLTEGELDAALLDSIGVPAISLTSGASMNPARHLTRWDRVIVAYDADQAGQEGADAVLAALLQDNRDQGLQSVERFTWDPAWGKDFGELRNSGQLGRVAARLITEGWD